MDFLIVSFLWFLALGVGGGALVLLAAGIRQFFIDPWTKRVDSLSRGRAAQHREWVAAGRPHNGGLR